MKGANGSRAETDVTATVDIQNVSEDPCPGSEQFIRWVTAALEGSRAEVSLRIVDEEEMAELNQRFRHRQGTTNVLSFPFEAPAGTTNDFLGDIVMCAPVVRSEALEQGKSEEAHWAHMTVHGVLHLRGYDHLTAEEAEEMETLERRILSAMGYQDPYLLEEISQS